MPPATRARARHDSAAAATPRRWRPAATSIAGNDRRLLPAARPDCQHRDARRDPQHRNHRRESSGNRRPRPSSPCRGGVSGQDSASRAACSTTSPIATASRGEVEGMQREVQDVDRNQRQRVRRKSSYARTSSPAKAPVASCVTTNATDSPEPLSGRTRTRPRRAWRHCSKLDAPRATTAPSVSDVNRKSAGVSSSTNQAPAISRRTMTGPATSAQRTPYHAMTRAATMSPRIASVRPT